MEESNGSVRHKYYCDDCKRELTIEEQEKPCPTCGSIKRHAELFVYEKAKSRDSLGLKAKNKTGKITRKFYARNKLSKTGKEAKAT